jgi:dienelactone hydrolase
MCGADSPAPDVLYRTQRSLIPSAVAAEGELVVERFPISYEGYTYYHAHIAYLKGGKPKPVVLIHPNYAGVKQFDIDQAAFLAKCGYVGFALDLYKETEDYTYEDRNPAPGGVLEGTKSNPALGNYPTKDAFKSTKEGRAKLRRHGLGAFGAYMGLLRDPKYWRGLMAAYLELARTHPAVHSTYAGAIGYCFGGQCVLDQVRAGHSIQAGVSFHGLLHSRPTHLDDAYNSLRRLTADEFEAAAEIEKAPNNYNINCKVLIENGDLDDEVCPATPTLRDFPSACLLNAAAAFPCDFPC